MNSTCTPASAITAQLFSYDGDGRCHLTRVTWPATLGGGKIGRGN